MKLTDLAPPGKWVELEKDTFLVNKITDISEDKVAKLAAGIPAITTEKAEILSQYITNQILRIVPN